MTRPAGLTRWAAPGGLRIDLVYRTHTSRTRRGGFDGWHLITRLANGVVVAEVPFGREVPEAKLAAALDAVGAWPVIGPPRATPPQPPVSR
jgi:hypothetical protein